MSSVIHRFGHVLNIDCHKKMVHAFVLPYIQYCLPVWGNSQAGLHSKMDSSLLHIIRIILHNSHAEFTSETYTQSGILSFKSFLFLCNVCCMFNFVRNDALSFYINTFLNSDCAVHSTRSVSSFKVQPIVRSRKADELCFQISAVSD